MEGLLNKIPGSVHTRAAVGTVVIMTVLGATFFGGNKTGGGQGAFDVSKPENVQASMDHAEQARLARFASGGKKE